MGDNLGGKLIDENLWISAAAIEIETLTFIPKIFLHRLIVHEIKKMTSREAEG